MNNSKIIVYTTNNCSSCQMLKKWLLQKEINFEVINVEEEPEKQRELIEKSGSFLVPVTVITDIQGQEEIIHGTQYAQIKKALNLD